MVQFSWPSEKAPAEIWCTTDCLTPYRHAKLWVPQFDHSGLLHACAVLVYNTCTCGGRTERQWRGSLRIQSTEHLQDELLLVPLSLWENIIATPCLHDCWRTAFQWWIGCTLVAAEVMGWRAKGWGVVGQLAWVNRGMKSGTAGLQPILGMLRSATFEGISLQKCTTPRLGCKGGKEKREWSNRWGSDSN